MSLGISARIGSLTECRRDHGEALAALALAKRLGRSAAIVRFDDLGVFSLLMRSDHADDLLHFAHRRLDPLITPERRRAKGLVKTLEIYSGTVAAATHRRSAGGACQYREASSISDPGFDRRGF